jgi:Zn finger protein HypA/HybF involved in hydrogenase expression
MTTMRFITTIYDEDGYELHKYECLNCETEIYVNEHSEYCSACGKKVDWSKS